MTQEEKAEAYDKALDAVKNLREINPSDEGIQNWVNENFPELRKSEDERIRKEILNYIDKATGCKRWVAWLEKQGKNIDGVEYNLTPKAAFHEGDWVIDKQGFVHQVANVVENVTNHTYGYDIIGGGYFNGNTEGVRLWNISDAKDGDILVFKNNVVGIIICKSPTHYDTRSYCRLSIGGDFINEEESGWDSTQLIPASKEQRDQLEKSMADAGYVFDFEKKELKEIENEEYDGEDYGIDSLWHAKNILEKTLGEVEGYQTDDGILDHKCAISFIDKLYKQKPAEWSEEDESNFQGIIDELKANKHHAPDSDLPTYDRFLSWFKSLKERYVWKPSDEQIDALEHFVRSIGESGFASPYDDNTRLLYSLLEQLKKL